MNNKPKILVVDDKEENLLVVESILEDLPLSIITASSGENGLKVLLKEDISVLLLDVRMPGMNGFETASFVRRSPKLKDLPIVFLSGSQEEEYSMFLEKYPENTNYIQKPLNISTLRNLVTLLLK